MKTILAVLSVWFCVIFSLLAATPPFNDLFANRAVLTGTNVSVVGNNSGATVEPGEDTGNNSTLRSVWYAWTAPTEGILFVSVDTTVLNFVPGLRIYRGDSLTSLVTASTLPDGGIVVTNNDTIIIQVTSVWTISTLVSGQFQLMLSLQIPAVTSPNDAFADRVAITAPDYHFDGGIRGATSEPGELLPPNFNRTLWWKFVAPENGVVSVAVSASQFPSVATFFSGTSLELLQVQAAVAENRYAVAAGEEYALQVASGDVPGGALSMDVKFLSLTNDAFAGRTRLEGTNISYVGNLLGATLEPNEPVPGYTNTVWVSWVAPFSGRAFYLSAVPDWAQPMAIFTGPTLDRLQEVPITPMDNGRRDFPVVGGEAYHIQMSGVNPQCQFNLQLLPANYPTNDLFVNARRVYGAPFSWRLYSDFVWLSPASAEPGEPAHLDGAPFKSLWWVWTAPVHGFVGFSNFRSLGTNVTLAAYRGTSVESLTKLDKGIGYVRFPIVGGETYYVAVAAPLDAFGDVVLSTSLAQSFESRIVPGNLLREPSWEGTGILDAQYWKMSGQIGGMVNEFGGCDGKTWPRLTPGAKVWQDIPTESGKPYAIRFAMRGGTPGYARVGVLWNGQQIGEANLTDPELGYWSWQQFNATANSSTSQVSFVSLGDVIELDAFSVVSLTDPPRIVVPPASASVIAGGTAVLTLTAEGSGPLTYHWFFNGTPFPPQERPGLVLEAVTAAQAGTYFVVVSNAYGSVSSAPVTLTIEQSDKPVIVWQPYGDTVSLGGFHQLSVVAFGSAPLSYQWTRNGAPIPGATNRILEFDPVELADEGTYAVRVQNQAGIVWSVEAVVKVDAAAAGGGGLIEFRNRFFSAGTIDAPVYDVDQVTLLNGSNYWAQLYAGPSLEALRPVGRPSPFQSGFSAGFFAARVIAVPSVPVGSNAIVQVRAWDSTKGGSYEEARGLGGRFGKSELMTVTLAAVPVRLLGLHSFSLMAGRSRFTRGEIAVVERSPNGTVELSHTGETGYRYLIERSVEGFEWRPFQLITNNASTVTFVDVVADGAHSAFYRSRILD